MQPTFGVSVIVFPAWVNEILCNFLYKMILVAAAKILPFNDALRVRDFALDRTAGESIVLKTKAVACHKHLSQNVVIIQVIVEAANKAGCARISFGGLRAL
jgi:hypothetical protein